MLNNVLPKQIYEAIINNVNYKDLYEIRFRLGKAICVNIKNKLKYVTENSLSYNSQYAIICTKQIINSIIFRASDQSIYAFNEQIKHGFITIKGGIRIGIAGQAVIDKKEVKTLKNFSSLNIRIPHEIKGCSNKALKLLLQNNSIYNTLIIAPPGAGKTTFLRDLACQISNKLEPLNLLILDERFEIGASDQGVCGLDVGNFSDVLSGIDKAYGFESGIRSMGPQIIFTDELANYADVKAIEYASGCGVKVVASAHGFGVEQLKQKSYFNKLLDLNIFERFVVLSVKNGAGTYEGIYDSNFNNLLN